MGWTFFKSHACINPCSLYFPKQHPTKIQTAMTLPPDPTLFLAHRKAHNAGTNEPTLQRAKNANAQPTHPR